MHLPACGRGKEMPATTATVYFFQGATDNPYKDEVWKGGETLKKFIQFCTDYPMLVFCIAALVKFMPRRKIF